MTRRGWLAAVLALLVALAAGCGIDASPGPEVVGDGLGGGSRNGDDDIVFPKPNMYSEPAGLINGFLAASIGAGETGINRVSEFLTDNGKKTWQRPPKDTQDLTVIRLVGAPNLEAEQNLRKPVSVGYQIVGTLSDRGRLTEVLDPTPTTRYMTFWVVQSKASPGQLLIDEISGPPAGLLISDQALTQYYVIQPIYFWDTTNSTLVPDLRYMPRGLIPEARATRVLYWLLEGPSAMLSAVQRLPSGTTIPNNGGVNVSQAGVLQVKLSAQAVTGDDKNKAYSRLLYQLQWSLRSSNGIRPAIELQVGNDVRDIAASDIAAQQYNDASAIVSTAAQTFDIETTKDDGGKVVQPGRQVAPDKPTLAVLGSKDNKNVVSAAVSRDGNEAAFVVAKDNTRSLVFARGDSFAPAPSKLHSTTLGRPVWIPGSDFVLVPSGGNLLAVPATGKGTPIDVTPRGVSNVTAVAVAPDGTRVAVVADGRVQVAQLVVTSDDVTVEQHPQLLIIDVGLVAKGVAWTSEEWLYIVGATSAGPRYYQVTADGAVAIGNNLRSGIEPTDIVAFPRGGLSPANIYVLTSRGAYGLFGTEAGLKSPFFIS